MLGGAPIIGTPANAPLWMNLLWKPGGEFTPGGSSPGGRFIGGIPIGGGDIGIPIGGRDIGYGGFGQVFTGNVQLFDTSIPPGPRHTILPNGPAFQKVIQDSGAIHVSDCGVVLFGGGCGVGLGVGLGCVLFVPPLP
jgi:hypothetical protein